MVSATTGAGLDEFLRAIGDRLRALAVVYDLVIPYDRGDIMASVHREGEIVSTTDDEAAWVIRARLSDASAGRLGEFITAEASTP